VEQLRISTAKMFTLKTCLPLQFLHMIHDIVVHEGYIITGYISTKKSTDIFP